MCGGKGSALSQFLQLSYKPGL